MIKGKGYYSLTELTIYSITGRFLSRRTQVKPRAQETWRISEMFLKNLFQKVIWKNDTKMKVLQEIVNNLNMEDH